jgi:hypothetical protein
MNLIQALANTPLRWTLEPVETLSPRDSRLPMLRMTVTPEPGATQLVRDFRIGDARTPESMMALLMKEHMPKDPVLRKWLDSKGNVPVELEHGAIENVAECMHTALRKLADSKQSCITWNALHHMHFSDRTVLWNAVRQVLTEAYAPGKPVTRRHLGTMLRDKVIAITDELRYKDEVQDDAGDTVKRKKLETFSLLMLHLGCEMTELEEWMWGWLGYVVKDVETPPAAAVSTTPVDGAS